MPWFILAQFMSWKVRFQAARRACKSFKIISTYRSVIPLDGWPPYPRPHLPWRYVAHLLLCHFGVRIPASLPKLRASVAVFLPAPRNSYPPGLTLPRSREVSGLNLQGGTSIWKQRVFTMQGMTSLSTLWCKMHLWELVTVQISGPGKPPNQNLHFDMISGGFCVHKRGWPSPHFPLSYREILKKLVNMNDEATLPRFKGFQHS